jgi:hypothetical protein
MSKEQNHQLMYTLVYKQHDEVKETTLPGRMLVYVLQDFLEQCIKEDDTGIFFELEYADVEFLKQNKRFHIVTLQGVQYGIILEDVKINTSLRNDYICKLRAKRELVGLSLEDFANMCALNPGDYKAKEEGHRNMKLSEYAQCMKILELYQNQK